MVEQNFTDWLRYFEILQSPGVYSTLLLHYFLSIAYRQFCKQKAPLRANQTPNFSQELAN